MVIGSEERHLSADQLGVLTGPADFAQVGHLTVNLEPRVLAEHLVGRLDMRGQVVPAPLERELEVGVLGPVARSSSRRRESSDATSETLSARHGPAVAVAADRGTATPVRAGP